MSNSSNLDRYYEAACEFTTPIRLNIPVWLEPEILVTSVSPVSQKLPIQLEPEIDLHPAVHAALPSCLENSHPSECETPGYETPDYETPDCETPDYETPDCETPDYETPDYETPEDCPIDVAPEKWAFLKISSVLLLLLCITAIVHSFV